MTANPEDKAMTALTHRTIEANGIRMHVAEQGEGPLVVLCHGFPESWYSWRHQLQALAAAGFRAVAPSMRGYGRTDRPEAIDQYTMLHLVGDMVGLLDALGVETAAIAGHDWGAPVAWHAALLRPDRFRAVIGLSVPFVPRGQVYPDRTLPETADEIFYQRYFQAPGVAEADLQRDIRLSLRSVFFGLSAEGPPRPEGQHVSMVPRNGGIVPQGIPAEAIPLPAWLNEADLEVYAAELDEAGFRGGLNWYRNIDRNWDLLAPFAGAPVIVPALFIAGERDLVLEFRGADRIVAGLKATVPLLRRTVILPRCGHWTQQEQPDAVNAAMIEFLRQLPGHG